MQSDTHYCSIKAGQKSFPSSPTPLFLGIHFHTVLEKILRYFSNIQVLKFNFPIFVSCFQFSILNFPSFVL